MLLMFLQVFYGVTELHHFEYRMWLMLPMLDVELVLLYTHKCDTRVRGIGPAPPEI